MQKNLQINLHLRKYSCIFACFFGKTPQTRGPRHNKLGSPTQTNEVFVVGRAEARVAFMPLGGIRCDRVAEGVLPTAQGKMAEWSIAAVLKTVDLHGSGGSNPSLSARKIGKTSKMKRGSRKVSSFCFWCIHEKTCKDAPCKVLGLRSNSSLSICLTAIPLFP